MQLGEGGRICYGGQASFDCSKKKERGGGLTASNKKGLGLDIRGQLLGKFQHFLFQFFSKQDEGSPYKDNTTGADLVDNAIAPGKIHNYVWEVPARAGPGPNDTDCLTWGYYSDVNPVKDTNTGLVGALVICRKVTLINRYWLRLRILASKASGGWRPRRSAYFFISYKSYAFKIFPTSKYVTVWPYWQISSKSSYEVLGHLRWLDAVFSGSIPPKYEFKLRRH